MILPDKMSRGIDRNIKHKGLLAEERLSDSLLNTSSVDSGSE